MSVVERQTKETQIRVEASVGSGVGRSQTGVEFLEATRSPRRLMVFPFVSVRACDARLPPAP